MMSSSTIFRPAIPLLIALIGGILIGSEYTGFGLAAAALAGVSAACMLAKVMQRRNGLIFTVLLFLALGYLAMTPWVQPRFPANHIIHHTGSTRWDISGIVDERPRHLRNRTQFVLRVVSLANGHITHAVSGKLRVMAVGELLPIAAGDELRFNSRIRPITNFKNPGAFDYQRYLAFKGIWTTAYVSAGRLVVFDRERASNLFTFIDNIRRTYTELIGKSGNPDSRAVLKALIVGDRTAISAEMQQAFNRAGVGHLLAISGLHIGIVATVAFFVFQFLATRINLLLWRAWSRKSAALLAVLPVLIYGVIAGFSPSTQRAVIMVAIFLLTFLFESEQDSLNTLSLAALVILVIHPPSLFSISFQLSFAAVLAIIYGLSRLQHPRPQRQTRAAKNGLERLGSIFLSFLLVSFLAICGSLPLVAYYFNQVSLIGLAANLFVVPLIGFVAVPLGLAALSVMPLSTSLASWLIEADTFILSYALELVNFFAGLPFAAAKTVTPSLIEIACFYMLAWALLNLYRFDADMDGPAGGAIPPAGQSAPATGNISQPGGKRSIWQTLYARHPFQFTRLKRGSLAKITVCLVLPILALDTGYWLYQRYWHPRLRVTIIDVGHGSAALLELPGSHTILVDGGGFNDNSTFDVGARIIAPFLWRKKIRTVDTLILSHPNSDHLNGLVFIALHFNVQRVWTNNESCDTKGYAKFMEVIRRQHIELPLFEKMPRRHRIDETEVSLLYPPPTFLDLSNSQKWRNTNNNSLVVKASLKSISFLFPGDIMAEAEQELVQLAGGTLSSTVLIAPHHGSRSSSSLNFIKAVNPEVTVISSGQSGRFKLPHTSVLERYREYGCQIWRTSLNGAVQLSTDGRRLDVKAFRDSGSDGFDGIPGHSDEK